MADRAASVNDGVRQLSGLLLLLPQAAAHFAFGPTRDDVALATTAEVRIPLESLRGSGLASVRFRVPDSGQWRRIRRAWGDHAYFVFVCCKGKSSPWVVPFGSLALDIQVRDGVQQLSLEPAEGPPYAYSADTTDFGRLVRAGPGADLQIDVRAAAPNELPSGELRIEPFWPGPMKDRIVEAMIEEEIRGPVRVGAAIGLALLVLGVVLTFTRAA